MNLKNRKKAVMSRVIAGRGDIEEMGHGPGVEEQVEFGKEKVGAEG